MSVIPDYKTAFKDESKLMKVLAKVLFFNKSFMTSYTTTLGHTIYFTNRSYVKSHPVTTKVTLVHELVHVKDYEKYGSIIFTFLYSTPQILILLSLPLLFVTWWVALAWLVICLLPLPAYFRMKLEQKAYTFSLYALHVLNEKNNYKIDFDRQIRNYSENFTKSGYYFMWPFYTDTHFKDALAEIKAGRKPYYEAEYYEMADKVLELDVKF